MPILSSAGIGSGLDVASIIQGLMQVEQRPLQIIEAKRQQITTQISAYGELISSISSFQGAVDKLNTSDALDIFKTSSTNENVINVTSTASPVAGSYDIQVTRLAGIHKMASAEKSSTDTFGGTAGDSLSIQVGSNVADTVTINLDTALSLQGIRDAINDATDNPGVRATIVNGDNDMQKLILTSDTSGVEGALTLSYGGTLSQATLDLQTLNNIGGDIKNLDAEFIVDGYTITRSDNTVNDVIDGVTFELVSADVGTAHTISISRDDSGVESLVQSFATAYNELRSAVNAQRSGSLATDNVLFTIERQLSSVLNTSVTGGAFSVLSELGLSIEKDGTMSLDSQQLTQALASGHDEVTQLFASSDGYAARLTALADSWIGSGGLLNARTDGLNLRIDNLSDRQLAIERNLELVEARYRNQFAALDTLVSQLQGTGSFLSSQLAQLPNLNRNRS